MLRPATVATRSISRAPRAGVLRPDPRALPYCCTGKTTLTEKLLLYGGAINQAGAVKAKGEQRRATSDFMELEQQRGISISSTVLAYEYNGYKTLILDTPGHQDFSEGAPPASQRMPSCAMTLPPPPPTLVARERCARPSPRPPAVSPASRTLNHCADTYRTLAAADNAVMLVDGAKGLEPQTRKLFEVARLRRLPIFTFVNKLDRPSLPPLQICDQIEAEFGIKCSPVLWPIGSGDRFKGVLDRRDDTVHLFAKGKRGGMAEETATVPLDSPELAGLLADSELHAQLLEDAEILRELAPPLDLAAIASGSTTPVFFGSAMSNFGVQLFLDAFMQLGLPPAPRQVEDGGHGAAADFSDGSIGADARVVEPSHAEFSGFVFKLQANLDPRHRDRMAYVRVCSGTFEPGLRVKHSRLKGKELTLSSVQAISGNERSTIDEKCYPGDVIGLNNPAGTFAIGDTIYTGSERISYSKIPAFSPEVFALAVNPSPSKYKQFTKGLEQLLDEGAVQRLREKGEDQAGSAGSAPILAAVGPLQFEVVQSRLASEYGVDVTLERLPFAAARWALAGWPAVEAANAEGKLLGVRRLEDVWGRPVLLFPSEWKLNSVLLECAEALQLRPYAVAPDVEERRRK